MKFIPKVLGVVAALTLFAPQAFADVSWSVSSTQYDPATPSPSDIVTKQITITLDAGSDTATCRELARDIPMDIRAPAGFEYDVSLVRYYSRVDDCLRQHPDSVVSGSESIVFDIATFTPPQGGASEATFNPTVGIYPPGKTAQRFSNGFSVSAAAISASDYGYSETLVECTPDVTWGDNADYSGAQGLDDAFEAAKPANAGETGVVGINPTNDGTNSYIITSEMESALFTNYSDKDLVVCGNGAKVELVGENTSGVTNLDTNYADKLTLYNMKLTRVRFSDPYRSMEVKNVTYDWRSIADTVYRECIGSVSDERYQDPDYTSINGYTQGNPDDPRRRFNVQDSTFLGCGGGYHSVYWAVRGCTADIDNIRVEHVGASEAFRSLCRVTSVRDSWLQNYIGSDGDNPGDTGVAPFDTATAGLLIFDNNVCEMADGTFTACVALRSRRSFFSSDMPGPCEQSGTDAADIPQCPNVPNSKWMDDTFWQNVSANPIDENNSYIFPKFFSNNTFRGYGTWTNTRTPVSAGNTSARRASGAYSSESQYVNHNQYWTERGIAFFHNNTCEGNWDGCENSPMKRTDQHIVAADSLPSQAEAQDFVDSTSLIPYNIISGGTPSWWPSTKDFAANCAEWEAKLIWPDEIPGGDGYPICPTSNTTGALDQVAQGTGFGYDGSGAMSTNEARRVGGADPLTLDGTATEQTTVILASNLYRGENATYDDNGNTTDPATDPIDRSGESICEAIYRQLNSTDKTDWDAMTKYLGDTMTCEGAGGYDADGNAILRKWVGWAYDDTERISYILGGGHNDGGDNSVYSINWDAPTGDTFWQRETMPAGRPNVSGCSEVWSGGTPPSLHTYDQLTWIPTVDKMMVQGGSGFCGSASGTGDNYFLWTPDQVDYSQGFEQYTDSIAINRDWNGGSGWLSDYGLVFYRDKGGEQSLYDPAANSWQTPVSQFHISNAGVTVECAPNSEFPSSDSALCVTAKEQTGLSVYSFDTSVSPPTPERMNLCIDTLPSDPELPWNDSSGAGAVGIAYDTDKNEFVFWNGGSKMASLPASVVDSCHNSGGTYAYTGTTGSDQFTLHTLTGTYTPANGRCSVNSDGRVYSKFEYVGNGLLIGVECASDGAWVFKR